MFKKSEVGKSSDNINAIWMKRCKISNTNRSYSRIKIESKLLMSSKPFFSYFPESMSSLLITHNYNDSFDYASVIFVVQSYGDTVCEWSSDETVSPIKKRLKIFPN